MPLPILESNSNSIMTPALKLDRATPSQGSETRRYSLFGRVVLSDIPLPIPPDEQESSASAPLWLFRLGRTPAPVRDDLLKATEIPSPEVDSTWTARWRQDDGEWLWYRDIATFHIPPGESRVDVYTAKDAQDPRIPILLLSHLPTLLLRREHVFCLHASAVELKCGAAAFIGTHGRGKSSMAASLLRLGATLITDDILPLTTEGEVVWGEPSVPIMKVWGDTEMGALGIDGRLPRVTPDVDKKLLVVEGPYRFANQRVPIKAFFVLDRYPADGVEFGEVQISKMALPQSLLSLLGQLSLPSFLVPGELPVMQDLAAQIVRRAPVFVLRYPEGFQHAPQVAAQINRRLAEL